jgi:hypothetical protein
MIISIKYQEVDKCKSFANRVVKTNFDCYRNRNQTNLDKIIDDITVGKIAEVASVKLMDARGIQHSGIDFHVYGKNGKSYDPDIYGWSERYDWKFHVKCMKRENAEKFGLSWTFQMEDPLVSDPDRNDYIIFSEMVDYNTIDIKTVVRANTLFNCWSEPKINKLVGIKKVIYWDTIKQLPGIKKL